MWDTLGIIQSINSQNNLFSYCRKYQLSRVYDGDVDGDDGTFPELLKLCDVVLGRLLYKLLREYARINADRDHSDLHEPLFMVNP